jgi:O-antigen/teichoic acid export membrane protein
MINRVRNLSKSEFGKNVLTLVTGTAAGQLLSILAAPALTRIYMPADYGVLGTFMAITGTIIIVATLQYGMAIMIPEKKEDSLALLHLSFLLVCACTVITFFLVWILNKPLLRLIRAEDLSYWIYLAPASVFFGGLVSPLSVWTNRAKAYKVLSLSRVVPQIFTVVVSIIIGLLVKGPTGLIISYILGQLINCGVLIFFLIRSEPAWLTWQPVNNLKRQIKLYRAFPLYTLPAEFINVFTSNLPVFLLNRFAGPVAVGAYNFSNRLLGMPSSIISGSIGEVFKQRATQDFHEKGNCENIFRKTAKHLTLFSILPFLIIGVFGDKIFVFAFGKPWLQAGEFSQIMAMMFMAKFIVSPLAYVYHIYNKLKEDFIIHIWILLSSFICFWVGFEFLNSTNWALVLFSTNYILIYILYYFRSFYFAKPMN